MVALQYESSQGIISCSLRDHQGRNLLHLCCSGKTYRVGWHFETDLNHANQIRVTKILLERRYSMLFERDGSGLCPILAAFGRGAVGLAEYLLRTLDISRLPESCDSEWISAVKQNLALYGCSEELEKYLSIGEPLNPNEATLYIKSAISGLGCRCRYASPDPWISTIRLLVSTCQPEDKICDIGDAEVPGETSIRGIIECAYGCLLSASSSQAERNKYAFVSLMSVLKVCHKIDFNPRFTGGISFKVECDICHERCNLGGTRTWVEGHSLCTAAARAGNHTAVSVMLQTTIDSQSPFMVGWTPNDVGKCKDGTDVEAIDILQLCSKLGSEQSLHHVLVSGKNTFTAKDLMKAIGTCCQSKTISLAAKQGIVCFLFEHTCDLLPTNEPPPQYVRAILCDCIIMSLSHFKQSYHKLNRTKLFNLGNLCRLMLDLVMVEPATGDWTNIGCWSRKDNLQAAQIGAQIVLLASKHNLISVIDSALDKFLSCVEGLTPSIFLEELQRQVHRCVLSTAPNGRRSGSYMNYLATKGILGILVGWLPIDGILKLSDCHSEFDSWGLVHYAVASGDVDALESIMLMLDTAKTDEEVDLAPLWGAGSSHPLITAIETSQNAPAHLILETIKTKMASSVLFPGPRQGFSLIAAVKCIDDRLTKRIIKEELAALERCKGNRHTVELASLAKYAQQLFQSSCRYGRRSVAIFCLDCFPTIFEHDGRENMTASEEEDACRRTDLHWCALHDMHEAIPALVHNKCKGNPDFLRDVAGCTALLYARAHGSVLASRALLECGASSMLRSKQVFSLWQHISYTTKTNLHDGLYVGVQFSLEPDEDDSIHGTVEKLFPAAITDSGESLFQVCVPNYADENNEFLETKLLTRRDMFKVFDAHYYFCYTTYQHHFEYGNQSGLWCYKDANIEIAARERMKNNRSELSLRLHSALNGTTKDFIAQSHEGLRPMDLGPIGWLKSMSLHENFQKTSSNMQIIKHAKPVETRARSFNIRETNITESSLLHQAARHANTENLIHALASTGIHIGIGEKKSGTTAIMFAVIYEQIGPLSTLMAAGANPRERCKVPGTSELMSPFECARRFTSNSNLLSTMLNYEKSDAHAENMPKNNATDQNRKTRQALVKPSQQPRKVKQQIIHNTAKNLVTSVISNSVPSKTVPQIEMSRETILAKNRRLPLSNTAKTVASKAIVEAVKLVSSPTCKVSKETVAHDLVVGQKVRHRVEDKAYFYPATSLALNADRNCTYKLQYANGDVYDSAHRDQLTTIDPSLQSTKKESRAGREGSKLQATNQIRLPKPTTKLPTIAPSLNRPKTNMNGKAVLRSNAQIPRPPPRRPGKFAMQSSLNLQRHVINKNHTSNHTPLAQPAAPPRRPGSYAMSKRLKKANEDSAMNNNGKNTGPVLPGNINNTTVVSNAVHSSQDGVDQQNCEKQYTNEKASPVEVDDILNTTEGGNVPEKSSDDDSVDGDVFGPITHRSSELVTSPIHAMLALMRTNQRP